MADTRRLAALGMPVELAAEVVTQLGTAGAIASVNGQTGTVVLTAADVSAAAVNVLNGQADVAVTYTANDPAITPNGAVTIADGAAPTVSELLEFCVELNAKLDAIITAMD